MADPFSFLLSKNDEDSLENKGFFYKEAPDYQLQKSSQYDAFYTTIKSDYLTDQRATTTISYWFVSIRN